MKKEVDLRGLVCPEPVLRTKKLLDDEAVKHLELLVESEVNVKNLERLAKSKSVNMTSATKDDYFKVSISKENGADQAKTSKSSRTSKAVQGEEVGEVLFLGKDTFGEGDEDFSKSLLNIFLQTMYDSGHRPRAILMANTGVRLMDPDGNVKPVLDQFKDAGCDVFACGLCVDFYGLKDKVAAEQVTNMFAICEYMMSADKVITP